jgi:O-antigen ligase
VGSHLAPAGVALTAATSRSPVAADAVEAVDLRWDPLLVCVAGFTLTSVGRVHQLFGVLEPFRLAILTGLLALLLYVADALEERSLRRVFVPTTKYVALLLVWMILSVPGSLSEGTAFDTVFGNFIKTALMYVIAAAAIRGMRDVERLAAVYLASAAIYAAVIITRFDIGDGSDWRLGHLYYYDANDFATLAVTAIPFGLYFLHAARNMALRALVAASLTVLTLAFVWSGSRGGFLALTAVGIFVVARYREIPLRWRLSATTLVLLVLLGAASDQYWQQMGTITSDSDYNRTGETGRLQIWERGIGYMLGHPVLGVGPSNFQTAEGTISPLAERQQFGIGVRWSAAHNTFIQAGAELGFPGLFFFTAMLVTAFRAQRQSFRNASRSTDTGRGPELTRALTASLIGFLIGSLFLSLTYSEMLYTLLAMVVGLNKVTSA